MLTVVHEICPTEGLGEYVGVLLGRSYVFHIIFNFSAEKVANEVVTHVYVFASGRAKRVFDQCFRPLIVLKDLYASSTRFRRNELQNGTHEQGFLDHFPSCNVFCL